MKTKAILIILIKIFCFSSGYCQEGNIPDERFSYGNVQSLNDSQKRDIIAGIRTGKNIRDYEGIAYDAIKAAIRYKVYEVIPALEENIWQRRDVIRLQTLKALLALNSPNTLNLTLAFIDSVDKRNLNIRESLREKTEANTILVELKDYSKADYVFQYCLVDKNYDYIPLDIFSKLITSGSTLSERARSALEESVLTAEAPNTRYEALFRLEEIYGYNVYNLMRHMILNDKFRANRTRVLNKLFRKHLTPEINFFLREHLFYEADPYVRDDIIRTLIEYYGSPSDYRFVNNSIEKFSADEARDYSNILQLYGPPAPNNTTPIVVMLDTLKSYISQSVLYDWLSGDLGDRFSLSVDAAKIKIKNNDSLACARIIRSIKTIASSEYKDSLNSATAFITAEGYKFLFNYSGYILNRLPYVPEVMPVEITSISPQFCIAGTKTLSLNLKGMGFSSGTVVDIGGIKREIIFVSDSSVTLIFNENDLKAASSIELRAENKDGGQSNIVMFRILAKSEAVDTLISKLNQSNTESQIKNKGLFNSLMTKLENSKKDLLNGSMDSALAKLTAFINELEAKKEKDVTLSAYSELRNYADLIIQSF